MLELLENYFYKHESCALKVNNNFFTESNIRCFDNDGFELTLLEQLYYTKNNFPINEFLNHNCLQKQWFTIRNNYEFVLDHALLLERKCFTDDAKTQLEEYSSFYPQLKKYLMIKPKWGIDFALEFYNNDTYMEVLHIEYDYQSFSLAEEAKEAFEYKLINTDWKDFVSSLTSKKEKWINLKGFDQNNWKASFWGLPKAEITFKSFFVKH